MATYQHSFEPVSYTHLDVYKRQGITGGFSRVESVSAQTLAQVMAVNVTGADVYKRQLLLH